MIEMRRDIFRAAFWGTIAVVAMATALALGGCGWMTVAPAPVVAKQAAIGDSGAADGGIYGRRQDGSLWIDSSARARYNALIDQYATKANYLVPPKKDFGVTAILPGTSVMLQVKSGGPFIAYVARPGTYEMTLPAFSFFADMMSKWRADHP